MNDGASATSPRELTARWQRNTAAGMIHELFHICPEPDRAKEVVRALYLMMHWKWGEQELPPMRLDREQHRILNALADTLAERHPTKDDALEVLRLLDVAVAWQFREGRFREDYPDISGVEGDPDRRC